MKIAIITTDNREMEADYAAELPRFGMAPEALFCGFADLASEHEIHIISFSRKNMPAPKKIKGNIYYHLIPISKWGRMKSLNIECIFKLKKLLKIIKPDIVHGQGTEKECAISAVFSGYKNVLTIHGNMRFLQRTYSSACPIHAKMTAMLEYVALKKADKVFCNSKYTESEVSQVTNSFVSIPNPIFPSYLEIPVKKKSFEGLQKIKEIHLINVGVICERKQQLNLIKWVESLSGSAVILSFIGNCPNNDYGREFLAKIDASGGKCQYLGMKSAEELIELYDNYDAMIHFPSEESFGLVVIEALARNLPVFASRVGGIMDISEALNYQNISLCEKWEELTCLLKDWIANGGEIKNSQEVIRMNYSPLVVAKRHIEEYQKILNKS